MGNPSKVFHDVLGGGVPQSNWQQDREVRNFRIGLGSQSGPSLCEDSGEAQS